MKNKKWDKEELKTEFKEMHRGNILFMMEGKTQEEQEAILSAGSQRKREQAYKHIKSLIEIFYAEEISQGEIKEDIPGPDLVDWLKGMNQAATSQKDHYTMKATTQLMRLVGMAPSVSEKWIDKWADELWAEGGILGKDDARAFIEKLATDLPARKPKASKEWTQTLIDICEDVREGELPIENLYEILEEKGVEAGE